MSGFVGLMTAAKALKYIWFDAAGISSAQDKVGR